jgi:HPr kinase/phosphorylase
VTVTAGPTIHASAVLVGAKAILLRGPAGSGKSQLALRLIQSAPHGPLRFVRLVADDRVHVLGVHGRLIARSPASLAGLLEIRGVGIRQLPYERMAVISSVVDLSDAGAERMPEGSAIATDIEGIRLPRLAVASGCDPFPMVLAVLTSGPIPATATCPDHARPGGHADQNLATESGRGYSA